MIKARLEKEMRRNTLFPREISMKLSSPVLILIAGLSSILAYATLGRPRLIPPAQSAFC